MQTNGIEQSRTIGKTYNSSNRKKCNAWNGKEKKNYGIPRSRNSFLKTSLKGIAPICIIQNSYDGKNLLTMENYNFLKDTMWNYSKLLGKEPAHNPGKSFGEGIRNLYFEMKEIIGQTVELNIDENDGKLFFNLWQHHEWLSDTLIWFPLKFLEQINPRLRRIVLSFLHEFSSTNHIDAIINDWNYEILIDLFEESELEYSKKDRKEITALINRYNKGNVSKLFDRLLHKSYYKDIGKAISNYHPENKIEQNLISLLKDGLQFTDSVNSIMDYNYDPYHDDDDDCAPVDLNQQIRFIYEYDLLTENLVECINNSYEQSYSLIPTSSLLLTPATKELFTVSDYPERFANWIRKYFESINLLYE